MSSNFVRARDLKEALGVLAEGGARVLAGGTDLMIHLRALRRAGEAAPPVVLDVTAIPELRRLDLDAARPYLGAGLSFRALESHPEISRRLPALAAAAASVGSVQVRSTATIGGNVANASPAADGVTPLVALGARAVVASARGARSVLVSELITAPNRTTLTEDELILGFELDDLGDPRGQQFAKVGRRQAVAIARLNLAVRLDRDLGDPRVVLGACFPSPRRLEDVEELIRGSRPEAELWRAAGAQAARHFTDVCGWRSSADYKVPAVTRMMARALGQAWERMGGTA